MLWGSSPENSDAEENYYIRSQDEADNQMKISKDTSTSKSAESNLLSTTLLSALKNNPLQETIPEQIRTSDGYNAFVFSQSQQSQVKQLNELENVVKKSKKSKKRLVEADLEETNKKKKRKKEKTSAIDDKNEISILKKKKKKEKTKDDSVPKCNQTLDSDAVNDLTNQLFSQFRDTLVDASKLSFDGLSQGESAQSTFSVDTGKLLLMRSYLDDMVPDSQVKEIKKKSLDKLNSSKVSSSLSQHDIDEIVKNSISDIFDDSLFKSPHTDSMNNFTNGLKKISKTPVTSKLSLIKNRNYTSTPASSKIFDKSIDSDSTKSTTSKKVDRKMKQVDLSQDKEVDMSDYSSNAVDNKCIKRKSKKKKHKLQDNEEKLPENIDSDFKNLLDFGPIQKENKEESSRKKKKIKLSLKKTIKGKETNENDKIEVLKLNPDVSSDLKVLSKCGNNESLNKSRNKDKSLSSNASFNSKPVLPKEMIDKDASSSDSDDEDDNHAKNVRISEKKLAEKIKLSEKSPVKKIDNKSISKSSMKKKMEESESSSESDGADNNHTRDVRTDGKELAEKIKPIATSLVKSKTNNIVSVTKKIETESASFDSDEEGNKHTKNVRIDDEKKLREKIKASEKSSEENKRNKSISKSSMKKKMEESESSSESDGADNNHTMDVRTDGKKLAEKIKPIATSPVKSKTNNIVSMTKKIETKSASFDSDEEGNKHTKNVRIDDEKKLTEKIKASEKSSEENKRYKSISKSSITKKMVESESATVRKIDHTRKSKSPTKKRILETETTSSDLDRRNSKSSMTKKIETAIPSFDSDADDKNHTKNVRTDDKKSLEMSSENNKDDKVIYKSPMTKAIVETKAASSNSDKDDKNRSKNVIRDKRLAEKVKKSEKSSEKNKNISMSSMTKKIVDPNSVSSDSDEDDNNSTGNVRTDDKKMSDKISSVGKSTVKKADNKRISKSSMKKKMEESESASADFDEGDKNNAGNVQKLAEINNSVKKSSVKKKNNKRISKSPIKKKIKPESTSDSDEGNENQARNGQKSTEQNNSSKKSPLKKTDSKRISKSPMKKRIKPELSSSDTDDDDNNHSKKNVCTNNKKLTKENTKSPKKSLQNNKINKLISKSDSEDSDVDEAKVHAFLDVMMNTLMEDPDAEDDVDMSKSQISTSPIKYKKKKSPKQPKSDTSRIKFERQDGHQSVITDEDRELLKFLIIDTNFEVPELHLVETGVARSPRTEITEQIIALGLDVKKGGYTPEESQIIVNNWKKFCKVHSVPQKPALFLTVTDSGSDKKRSLAHSEILKFVRFLAQGLPNRLLCSVYKRFKTMYSTVKRGRFSKEEDEIILETINNCKDAKNIFVRLGRELNREPICVEKHYIWLRDQEKHDYRIDRIRSEDGTDIVTRLMREMECEDIEQLKYKHIPFPVFIRIGEELQLRPLKIQQFWLHNLHPKLFVTGSRLMFNVKEQLIDLILANPECKTLYHVRYQDYIPHMDGWTGIALGKMLRNMLRAARDSNPILTDFREQLMQCKYDLHNEKAVLKDARFVNGELIID